MNFHKFPSVRVYFHVPGKLSWAVHKFNQPWNFQAALAWYCSSENPYILCLSLCVDVCVCVNFTATASDNIFERIFTGSTGSIMRQTGEQGFDEVLLFSEEFPLVFFINCADKEFPFGKAFTYPAHSATKKRTSYIQGRFT